MRNYHFDGVREGVLPQHPYYTGVRERQMRQAARVVAETESIRSKEIVGAAPGRLFRMWLSYEPARLAWQLRPRRYPKNKKHAGTRQVLDKVSTHLCWMRSVVWLWEPYHCDGYVLAATCGTLLSKADEYRRCALGGGCSACQ